MNKILTVCIVTDFAKLLVKNPQLLNAKINVNLIYMMKLIITLPIFVMEHVLIKV